MENIKIYTDGSYDANRNKGGWAAIVFISNIKTVLQGFEVDSTHQRMELTAVINALNFLRAKNLLTEDIFVYTDSQYVVGLQQRKEKLESQNFITNKGSVIRNDDLLKLLFPYFDYETIHFIKIKAHQKNTSEDIECNREVDFLSRKIVRT